MIPNKTLHRELDRRLNRIASNHAGTYTVADKDSFINRAIQLYQENITALAEKNARIREYIRPLLVSGMELKEVLSNKEFNTYEYPEDYYRRAREFAKAKRADCPERTIKIVIIEKDDLNNLVDDCFWNASFEWGSTIASESQKGLEVYHQEDFQITHLYIDYYKEIPPVYSPSLIKSQDQYEHPITCNVITKDQGLTLCNDRQMNMILDATALLFRIARGDSVELQLELSNIFNIDKIYLN